jgi:hypothetical protein
VHFDAAGSYEVWPGVRAGLAGYYLKQITDARIGGHTVPSQGRVERSGPAWSCPGRILPLPRRPLRGRRAELPPREEARVASVESILMADSRSSLAEVTPEWSEHWSTPLGTLDANAAVADGTG